MDFFAKKKNDLLLLAALICAGLIFALVLFFTRSQGGLVIVCVDGKEVYRHDLSVDTVETITGADGGSNTITVKNGKVAVTEADCPDGLCVNTGYISTSDQSIICLPHKLVVSIEGADGKLEMDGVAK